MPWTITGETGATLNATARSPETLNISAAVLRFQAVATDSITWTAATENAAGAGTMIPDLGQTVAVWRDGVRKFYGWVTSVRPGTREVTVTASGPWHWLERIGLTGLVLDGEGNSAERPLYAAPTQDLAATLAAIADRAISAGDAPMRRAAVAAVYPIPNATLAEQSVASALATLLAWCPDMICWFDYSDTTGNGLPILNFGRRGDFTETILTYGTDAIESADLAPRLDLEVAAVDLSYVTRNQTTGRPQWASLSAGTAARGKRQLIAISGPELPDYLPRDDFESHVVSSAAIGTAPYLNHDAAFQAAAAQHGPLAGNGAGNPYGYLATSVQYWGGGTEMSTAYSYHPWQNLLKSGGGLPAGAWYFVTAGAPLPDWLRAAWGAIEVTITRTHVVVEPSRGGTGVVFPVSPLFDWCRYQPDSSWWTTSYDAFWNAAAPRYCFRALKVDGWAIPTARNNHTAYKPWEYDFLTPPATLADDLRAAQAWVPWEGQLTLVVDDCDGAQLLPRRYHLAGGYPAQAAMGAMARAVEHDLARGRTTIELGAPARLDFGTLVSRIRRDPKDNIVWI